MNTTRNLKGAIADVIARLEHEHTDPGIFATVLGAVAAGRNLLVTAYPGVGVTMAVRAAWTLLPDVPIDYPRPPWALDEAMFRDPIPRPSFRAPHHTCSLVGLLGGGRPVRPGEVSLAHGGVLLLDELPEFKGSVIEHVAHALADGEVTIVTARETKRFAARPRSVIATMHRCPCGMLGHPDRACVDPPSSIARWTARVDVFRRKLGPLGLLDVEPTPPACWAEYRDNLRTVLTPEMLRTVFESYESLDENATALVAFIERCDPRWRPTDWAGKQSA